MFGQDKWCCGLKNVRRRSVCNLYVGPSAAPRTLVSRRSDGFRESLAEHPNDLTTDEEILEALEAAKEFDGEPRALSAVYVGGAADGVVIRLSTGGRLTIPREDLQEVGIGDKGTARGNPALGGVIGRSWMSTIIYRTCWNIGGPDKWMEGFRLRGVAA